MGERQVFPVPQEFETLAKEIGLPDPRKRDEGDNIIPLWESELFISPSCDCRFEFGDLGYSRGKRHLVVEWETASGVANWLKLLAYVGETPGQEVRLLHVHQKPKAISTPKSWYLGSRMLQDWVTQHVRETTGSRFEGRSLRWPDERDEAERLFRLWGAWLTSDQGSPAQDERGGSRTVAVAESEVRRT